MQHAIWKRTTPAVDETEDRAVHARACHYIGHNGRYYAEQPLFHIDYTKYDDLDLIRCLDRSAHNNAFDCMSSNSIDDAALTKCRIADIYAFPPMRSLHDANDCDGTVGTHIANVVSKKFYTGGKGRQHGIRELSNASHHIVDIGI